MVPKKSPDLQQQYIDTTTDHITPCSRMRARGNYILPPPPPPTPTPKVHGRSTSLVCYIASTRRDAGAMQYARPCFGAIYGACSQTFCSATSYSSNAYSSNAIKLPWRSASCCCRLSCAQTLLLVQALACKFESIFQSIVQSMVQSIQSPDSSFCTHPFFGSLASQPP